MVTSVGGTAAVTVGRGGLLVMVGVIGILTLDMTMMEAVHVSCDPTLNMMLGVSLTLVNRYAAELSHVSDHMIHKIPLVSVKGVF